MPDSLQRYATARDDVAGLMDELSASLADARPLARRGRRSGELRRTAERLRTGRFVLAVVGEFSSGKSFLLNALLGKIALRTARRRRAHHRLARHRHQPVDRDDHRTLLRAPKRSRPRTIRAAAASACRSTGLSRFVAVGDEAKLHDATSDENDAPALVRVGVDSAFLRNGFVVADTPGLASINPAHRRATLAYLPGADAVLYLIDTQQPFTDGDASFLGIIRRYIESMFIVQTKIDLWRMTDGGREAWQAAAARIVAQAAVHAPDTPVFPLSAREYAEGLLTGNAALVEQSRFRRILRRARRLARRDDRTLASAPRRRRSAPHRDARRRRAGPRCGGPRGRAGGARRRTRRARAGAGRGRRDAPPRAVAELLADRRAPCTPRSSHGGATMREALHRTLSRAFDTADIARLRDRAKLHILVDETLAAAMGRFAGDVADVAANGCAPMPGLPSRAIVADHDARRASQPILGAVAAERLPVTEDAARAFDADAGERRLERRPRDGTARHDRARRARRPVGLAGRARSRRASRAGRRAAT